MSEYAERMKKTLNKVAKGLTGPPPTGDVRCKAALALALWEQDGDWTRVPQEVADIVRSMGTPTHPDD